MIVLSIFCEIMNAVGFFFFSFTDNFLSGFFLSSRNGLFYVSIE